MADETLPLEDETAPRALALLYRQERERLFRLAAADAPQGEYARPVFGEGCFHARVMLVGEAPGAEETKRCKPFVGKAGKQLDELFALFGVTRGEAFITNTVKYRPVVRSVKSIRNRPPTPREIEDALPLLAHEIERIRPAFVCTLGNTPLKAVLRLSGRKPAVVGGAHGTRIPLEIGGAAFELIPLYHPASGIYNRSLIETMREDAAFVGRTVKNKTRDCTTAPAIWYTESK